MATETTTNAPSGSPGGGLLNPLLAPHQVLIKPLVTEKGMHRASRVNAYAFVVNKQATKYDIRNAVEELFNVKVVKVYIQNRKGKPRRSKFKVVMTGDWKKAIVKLAEDNKIDFF